MSKLSGQGRVARWRVAAQPAEQSLPALAALAALVAVTALLLGHDEAAVEAWRSVPWGPASAVVFRAISYWLPFPVGLWMGRRLRVSGLL